MSDRHLRRSWCIVLTGFAATAAAIDPPSCLAQAVRLDLRIVPQSGIPGPASCVYHDPPTPLGGPDPPVEAWAGVNIARRFEIQYRLVDLVGSDGLSPRGLRSLTLDIRAASPTAGLWARSLLSRREGEPTPAEASQPVETVDCSGLSARRGLHGSLRGALGGTDPNEDPDNGTFAPDGLRTIRALALGPNNQADGAWFGLYSFDFVPAAGLSGSLTITAAVAGPFEWFDQLGVIQPTPAGAQAFITVRVPATAAACCARRSCFIALSPSACFAEGGFIATLGTCGSGSGAACCFGDFNRDGVLGVQDLFDFLVDYQRGLRTADVNGSGLLSVQDVFDFLASYFTGCGT